MERAPWCGGFFERMIGTVKRCLKKVIGNARLSFEELETVLAELEGTLNSRPLTHEYHELGAETLTPSHLIFGRRLPSMPDDVAKDDKQDDRAGLLKRFRYLARKRAHFLNRWHREHLVDLREQQRRKSGSGERSVEVGEIVFVNGENEKRGMWRMGRTEEEIEGRDRIVRGARV